MSANRTVPQEAAECAQEPGNPPLSEESDRQKDENGGRGRFCCVTLKRFWSPSFVSDAQLAEAPPPRRHDMDGLRAAAMLLGIAYHCALSFSLGPGWVVEDCAQSKALYVFQAFVHGFRMQVFMLMSGFFTAMLWRRRGLKALLLNRFRRVLLPCLAGLATVVPAVNWAGVVALKLQPPLPRFPREGAPYNADIFHSPQEATDKPLPRLPTDRGTSTGRNPSSAVFSSHNRFWNRRDGRSGNSAFTVLWFLWFLVWFLPVFSVCAAAAERFGWNIGSHALLLPPWNMVWLLPLTMLPALRMNCGTNDFGPETSIGLLPAPHVLVYYGIFFGFGAIYHECGDTVGRLGRSWRWGLALAIPVIFPLALELAAGPFGFQCRLPDLINCRGMSVFFQVLYAWMMSFACIGLFREWLKGENRLMRYASDAAYWCYLAHLPVTILAQGLVCRWPLPSLLKFLGVLCCVLLVMFWSYEALVRRSWLGAFLHGRPAQTPRTRAVFE